MTESFVLPVAPTMAPVARSMARSALGDDCPRASDLVAVVGEFVDLAVCSPGSRFEVRIDVKPGRARIEVDAAVGYTGDQDAYVPALARLDDLTDRWGLDSDGSSGTWWAELHWAVT